DWSQDGWDISSRPNVDAAATGGSARGKTVADKKVGVHHGAGQWKCVCGDQTGLRPLGRALGRHRNPRFGRDAGIDAFKPLIKPAKKLCPQKKRFRISEIARCRRMAQAAEIHLEERDGGAGLK